jgi:hypothetical protein
MLVSPLSSLQPVAAAHSSAWWRKKALTYPPNTAPNMSRQTKARLFFCEYACVHLFAGPVGFKPSPKRRLPKRSVSFSVVSTPGKEAGN